jgi:hypothetical protein
MAYASINFYVSSRLQLSQLHLSVPVLLLSPLSSILSSLYNFLTKFLSNLKLIVVLYMWRISSMYWFFSLFFLGRCALVESCLGDMKRGDSIIKVFKTWVYYTIYMYTILYTYIKLFILCNRVLHFAFWSILQLETITINQE